MICHKIVPMLPPFTDRDAFVAEVRRQLPTIGLRYGQAIRSVEAVELITDPGALLAHHAEHHVEGPCADGCSCDEDVAILARALALELYPAVAVARVDAVVGGRDS